MKNKPHWIIQNNLIHENSFKELQQACIDTNVTYEEIVVIPFLDTLPEFKIDPNNVYYGSTTLMYNIYNTYKPKGLFFDDKTFSMENYNKHWGEHMLNYEGKVLTLGVLRYMLMNEQFYPPEHLLFIRPDADDKSFAGSVRSNKDILNWIDNLPVVEKVDLNLYTKVLVSTPWNIKKEWRNYIVGGKLITSSLYQKNFKLSKSSTDIPEKMLTFVEDRIKEYTPHDNFVMDIALCGDEYFIIECGCLNSVGLYSADVNKLVSAINDWMRNN